MLKSKKNFLSLCDLRFLLYFYKKKGVAKSFQETYQKRRLLTGYFSVIVSISFVLFFVGVLGLFLLNTKNIASHFKEQIVMTIYLEDSAKDIEITQLQKKIKINSATKKVRFTPKEEAAELYARDIGEDFIEFLGYNPLLNSIDIYFNAAFVNRLSLTKIKREFEITNFVNEVVYDQPLVILLDENIRKVTYVLLITTGLFILIALLLINSSIRLSIYSKRFIIRKRKNIYNSTTNRKISWLCYKIYPVKIVFK